jgi:hypothetical protein
MAVSWLLCPLLQAHIVLPQHGFLNLEPEGVYLTLSVPVSGFANPKSHLPVWDERELRTHEAEVKKRLLHCLQIKVRGLRLEPHVALVNLSKVDDANDTQAAQLLTMTNFIFKENPLKNPSSSDTNLRLSVSCFGQSDDEKEFEISLFIQKKFNRTLLFYPNSSEINLSQTKP